MRTPETAPTHRPEAAAGVRALAFDVFGTVVDWRTSIAEEAARVLGDRHPGADWERFADGWRRRYQPSLERVRSGAEPWRPLDALHADSLDGLLRELGLIAPAPARRALVMGWHRLRPWPDAAEGLRRLSGRFVLATLSNGNVSLLEDLVRHGGLPFHRVLSAEHARGYKPQPRVYRTAVARLGLEPAEVMMVAAHWDDLEAAAALGLRTAFVRRPLEWGPAGRPDLERRPWVDADAADLVDLAAALGC
jgi:2-haloacid dehalogenase